MKLHLDRLPCPSPCASLVIAAVAGIWLLLLAAGLSGHCLAPDIGCAWMRASFVLGMTVVGAYGVMTMRGVKAAARTSFVAMPADRPANPVSLDLPASRARARVYARIADVPHAAWEGVVASAGPFMRTDYLRALAESAPAGIHPLYVLLERDGQPVAAATFQVLEVRPDALGADAERWRLPARMFLSLLRSGPRGAVRVLVCGNVLHSRAGGFHASEALAPADVGELLAATTEALRRHLRADGPIALTMLKDLAADHPADDAALRARGYHRLEGAQPTMELALAPGWRSFDDYLAAMSAKYRKRAKAARRKGAALRRIDLPEAALLARGGELERLLEAVVSRAEFKLTAVSLETIACLKRQLGDRLAVTAYEHDGALVGFTAALVDRERFEALFVGLDYEVNQALQVYQNMLYDFVEAAIRAGCRTVHLGRTALEIKSTIGAEPAALRIYVRHPAAPINLALGRIAGLTSAPPWVQRHPFRAEADGDAE